MILNAKGASCATIKCIMIGRGVGNEYKKANYSAE